MNSILEILNVPFIYYLFIFLRFLAKSNETRDEKIWIDIPLKVHV